MTTALVDDAISAIKQTDCDDPIKLDSSPKDGTVTELAVQDIPDEFHGSRRPRSPLVLSSELLNQEAKDVQELPTMAKLASSEYCTDFLDKAREDSPTTSSSVLLHKSSSTTDLQCNLPLCLVLWAWLRYVVALSFVYLGLLYGSLSVLLTIIHPEVQFNLFNIDISDLGLGPFRMFHRI